MSPAVPAVSWANPGCRCLLRQHRIGHCDVLMITIWAAEKHLPERTLADHVRNLVGLPDRLARRFLAHIALPDGRSVAEWVSPQLTAGCGRPTMPAVLPGASPAGGQRDHLRREGWQLTEAGPARSPRIEVPALSAGAPSSSGLIGVRLPVTAAAGAPALFTCYGVRVRHRTAPPRA